MRHRYVDDGGRSVAVVHSDLAFVHTTGAALVLIPPGRVLELVGSELPAPDLLEHHQEVMNVLSRWVAGVVGTHVRVVPGEAGVTVPPGPAWAVSVAGYPTGHLVVERTTGDR